MVRVEVNVRTMRVLSHLSVDGKCVEHDEENERQKAIHRKPTQGERVGDKG